MFSHIFSKRKNNTKSKEMTKKKSKPKTEVNQKSSEKAEEEEENEVPSNKDNHQINTADINYKEYDQVHSLCMRVIVYFVSKYVIVYDIKT
jgi:hypothetical protein